MGAHVDWEIPGIVPSLGMAYQEGGFDCEFEEKPSKGVQSECPVCLLVLRKPYQVTCCGYGFCRVCIEPE